MRRAVMTLALAGLLGSPVLSNVSLAGCPPKGDACAPKPKHAPCHAPERCKKYFAKWDACREKFDKKIDNLFNPTWCQKGATYALAPCAVPAAPSPPAAPTPQAAPSGQGS